ncbi:MAG: M48 family metallopeptidase [Alphaproteobacteria bacterium]
MAKTRSRASVVRVNGRTVPLNIRRSQRAKRLLLRVSLEGNAVELVLPRWVAVSEGLRFAASKSGWIERQLAGVAPPIRLAHGVGLPLLGVRHRIVHRPDRPPRVEHHVPAAVDEPALLVGGPADEAPGRLTSWLHERARMELARVAADKARLIGRKPPPVTVRDPKTRWGSCSPAGRLSFSWRLVMAPRMVIDYVVAHEVAHLVELNHGKRFWALVGRLTRHADSAREWLRTEGIGLYRFG